MRPRCVRLKIALSASALRVYSLNWSRVVEK